MNHAFIHQRDQKRFQSSGAFLDFIFSVMFFILFISFIYILIKKNYNNNYL